jgi:hypothetical protein
MYSPSQRVRAKANFLRFGTVEAHIGDDVYVVWDESHQAVEVSPEEIQPATPDEERKAIEGTQRFLGAVFG